MTTALNNKFTVITSPSVITFLLFNRASLDFIKNKRSWMFQSGDKLEFTSPHNAARIAKVMRKYDDVC